MPEKISGGLIMPIYSKLIFILDDGSKFTLEHSRVTILKAVPMIEAISGQKIQYVTAE